MRNVVGYVRYLLGQRWARRSMKQLIDDLVFEPADESALAMWTAIDDKFDAAFHSMDFHLVSSATSGIMTPILLGVLAKGETPREEHHVEVAALLAGAKDVESADIAEGAARILDELLADREACEHFVGLEDDDAVAWLRGDESQEVGRLFRAYLERHGHRAIKELELRQPEWREDPLPLVVSLKASARSRLRSEDEFDEQARPAPADETRHGIALRLLTRFAHQTVRSREETKSGLVAVGTRFKEGYRELARRMVAEGLLTDEDAVFFLMHEELGRLVRGERPGLVARALERRSVLDRQAALQFDDIVKGEPIPIVPELPEGTSERMLSGTAVSRGRIVGTARVVHTPAEAEALERGEILIAPITDVGWTPYFSLISGLVTDIGSAVSHGAVVAREFGLPAVVNTRFATQVFKTGDRVVLDADHGHVRIATAID
jgi:pyruvate,water dikinase